MGTRFSNGPLSSNCSSLIAFFIHTVWSNSTVTFDDGIAPKVIKIIQFYKKYLKDDTLAFDVHQFLGVFDKNWTLLSHS